MSDAAIGEWVPLIEARQRMPKASGLYCVRHRTSGKEYIGLSQNIRQRTSRHLHAAKQNSLLHRAVRKHGASEFEICVHVLAEFAALPALEAQVILERRTMTPAGYNLTAGGEGTVGRRHTDTAKEKMRQARLGTTMPAEVRAKISAAAGALWTPEMRAKMSAAVSGKVRTAETRLRMGEANRRRPPEHWERVAAATRAREVTAETRQKMAANARNRPIEHRAKQSAAVSQAVMVQVPGEEAPREFSSGRAAAAWAGILPARVCEYCKGQKVPRNGYRYWKK